MSYTEITDGTPATPANVNAPLTELNDTIQRRGKGLSEYADFAAAASDAPSTIVVDKASTVLTATTIPAGTTLKVVPGNVLQINATLTINGAFPDPGPVQVFDLSGGGSVLLNATDEVRPEWFESGHTSAGVQAALTALGASVGRVKLGPYDYTFTDEVEYGIGQEIVGCGKWESVVVSALSASGSLFKSTNPASTQRGPKFKSFRIELLNDDDIGIDLGGMNHAEVDVWIDGGTSLATRRGYGVVIDATSAGAYVNRIDGSMIRYCKSGVLIRNGANENTVLGGEITSCGVGVEVLTNVPIIDSITLFGVRIEGCATYGVDAACRQLRAFSCRLENMVDAFRFTDGSVAPHLLVGNYYADITGSEVTVTGASTRVLRVGEHNNHYDVLSGTGEHHLPYNDLVFGNSSTNNNSELRVRGTGSGDKNLHVIMQGSGALISSGPISTQATAARLFSGDNSPESVVTANIGSVYLRTNGAANTTFYVKEANSSNTGWVAK